MGYILLFSKKTRSKRAQIAVNEAMKPVLRDALNQINPNLRTQNIIDLINSEHADPEFTLEKACKKLQMNRNKVNSILKSELGVTFNAYLVDLRLKKAAILLGSEKDVNVSEIAFFVGFNSLSHFSKTFKSRYGCTPKEYRNQNN